MKSWTKLVLWAYALLLFLGVFFCCVLPTLGQCPGGVCPIPIKYEWRPSGVDGEFALYQNGRQIGSFSHAQGAYRPLLDYAKGTWGEPRPAPIAPPKLEQSSKVGFEQGLIPNFGLDFDKLNKRPVYKFCFDGREKELSSEQAHDLVEKGIPDYSGKLRLTVIADEAVGKKVIDDWSSDPKVADVRDKILASWVKPDHWWLKDTETGRAMFKTDGNPTIYCQVPNGSVLHRQDGYGGVEDFQAIRLAVQNYDPAKDPDLRTSNSGSVWRAMTMLGIGFLVAIALGERRK